MNNLNDPSDAVPAATAAALDASEARDPVDVRELDPVALERLVASLSVSARKALGVADALRRERGADAVHMEHLLVGLYVEHGGHQWRLLHEAGLDAPALAQRLRQFELPVEVATISPGASDAGPSVSLVAPRAPAVAVLPPLSEHARLALAAAVAVSAGPRATPGVSAATIQARHLLAGWCGIFECHVVAALTRERLGIRNGVAGAIATDHAAGTLDAATANAQLARLDALLDTPPRVRWERLAAPAATPRITSGTKVAAAAPRTGSGGGAANDRAEGDDRLNFSHYVQAFADLIDSPDTRPPLTIGIFGAWGSGKSFILRHVTDEIKRRSAGRQPSRVEAFRSWATSTWHRLTRTPQEPTRERAYVYCIEFNAWEYNAAEHIWPRLVRRVLDGVERKAQWHRTPLRWAQTFGRKLKRNFVRKLRAGWKGIAGWLVITVLLWWAFTHLRPDEAQRFARRVFGADLADDAFSVPAILGALGAAVKLVADSLLAPLGGWVTAMLDDAPSYGTESDFVRAVQADLRLIDRQLLTEGSRVLIVIDDLDRCEPNKAVEVLQAINQLLDRRSFVICLGIDARVITAAVEKHYEQLLGPAGITGYEYLDKIVQIPFRIPDPSGDDIALFVSKQLGDPAPPPPPPSPTSPTSGTPIDATATRAAAASASDDEAPARRPTRPLPVDLSGGVTADRGGGGAAKVPNESPAPPFDAAVPAPLSFTHDELKAFEDIRHCIRPNPRHVKRLVNVYALVRSLATLAGNRTILDDPAATVRWLTLCAQWPYAVYRMLQHLDVHGLPARGTDDAEGNDASDAPEASGRPPLRRLYDAVSGSLDPAKRARFDHDVAGLTTLIESSAGISTDELRVLRGYTVNFNPALDAELRADDADRKPARSVTHATLYDRRRAASAEHGA